MAGTTKSVGAREDLDRSALIALLDSYGKALVAHEAKRLPLAPNVRFTENGQTIPLTEGLWCTASGIHTPRYAEFADPRGGAAGFFGVAEENGAQVLLGARLKTEGGLISEIETLVIRPHGLLFNPAAMLKPASVYKTIAPSARASREELVAAASAYFNGIERSNGRMIPVLPDCLRIENGTQTVLAAGADFVPHREGFSVFPMGVADQIDSGFFAYIARIRDRRFPVIDEEQSLVLVIGLFDHPGNVKTVEVKGVGRVDLPPFTQSPFSLLFMEAFQVENGKIRGISAVMEVCPYGYKTGWE
jgi:hypothetical protein